MPGFIVQYSFRNYTRYSFKLGVIPKGNILDSGECEGGLENFDLVENFVHPIGSLSTEVPAV
jgi:hypothetical protein